MSTHTLMSTFLLVLAACGEADDSKTGDTTPPVDSDARVMAFTSSAFADGADIPVEYTCNGADTSPPLAWTDLPLGAMGLAVMVVDPDAADCPHWAVYDLPANLNGLDAAVSPGGALPAGALELANFRGTTGWAGPCPPARHTYTFTLYALDVASLGLESSADFSGLAQAMEPHLLGSATFSGQYEQ